jgi:hypothetical protein
MKYRERLDNLVKSYLKKENRNNEINDYLKECFLSKLENFSKKNQIDINFYFPLISFLIFYSKRVNNLIQLFYL